MKKKIDLPYIKGEIEISSSTLSNERTKEFFKRSDIKEALESGNLDHIYEEWDFIGCHLAELTCILLLANIDVLEYLVGIPAYCFYGCDITSITIPEGFTYIEDGAFYGCNSLTSVTLPESVQGIGARAFAKCNSLESIIIPKSVIQMDYWVFDYCSNLKTIYCEAKEKPTGWKGATNWLGDCKAKVIWGA